MGMYIGSFSLESFIPYIYSTIYNILINDDDDNDDDDILIVNEWRSSVSNVYSKV